MVVQGDILLSSINALPSMIMSSMAALLSRTLLHRMNVIYMRILHSWVLLDCYAWSAFVFVQRQGVLCPTLLHECQYLLSTIGISLHYHLIKVSNSLPKYSIRLPGL